MSKILTTGGAGFIGSNLFEHFLGKGHEVICLDNFATGHQHNIKSFLANSKFTFIEGDNRDFETPKRAIENVDYVLDQAALGSVLRSIYDPITNNEVNVSGFLNMLVASKDANERCFIYAASSTTYGDSEELPKVEDKIGKPLSPCAITKDVNELYAEILRKTYGLETIGLRYFNDFENRQEANSPYSASKAASGHYVRASGETYGLPYVITNYFTNYGTNHFPEKLIPLFIYNNIEKKPLLVYGDGKYTCDWLYAEASDLVFHEGKNHETYNIGGFK
jgi:dTDP-D-glucose 4,6-dehydratase